MKITFLGTGAGEGYPGLWCQCVHCSYARKHGGKIQLSVKKRIPDNALTITQKRSEIKTETGKSKFGSAKREKDL